MQVDARPFAASDYTFSHLDGTKFQVADFVGAAVSDIPSSLGAAIFDIRDTEHFTWHHLAIVNQNAGKRVVNETKRFGLARALSKLGYCSRSQAAKLIRAGRVRLNGATRFDPETPVRLERDRVDVDRTAITGESKVYLLLNKPRGVITTASDEKDRQTVYAFLKKDLPWVAPVGRLDKASEGLLLLTNDSTWAARISDPESHLDKTYHVQVNTPDGETMVKRLQEGVPAGGELLRAKHARVLRVGEKNIWLEIVLDEGKNRQIRRMIEHLGNEVLRLVRVAIGPLALGSLAKGKCRELSPTEKTALDQSVQAHKRNLHPRDRLDVEK